MSRQVGLEKFVFLIAFVAVGTVRALAAETPRHVSLPPGFSQLKTLSQNWTEEQANRFYSMAQGSQLVPYAWYLNLEQPNSTNLFRDNEHIRGMGYLPRTADPLGNPDGLAIGFVKDGLHLGLSCAACHTTQIHYQGTAYLVDGAPTLGDMTALLQTLAVALEKTLADDAKFRRFSARVLGPQAEPVAIEQLKSDLAKTIKARRAYNDRNLPKPGALLFGPGRLDAFGAILNEVTEVFAQAPGNSAPADAPVSYPFLWDTPHHDFVQWNGAAPNKKYSLLKPILGTSHFGALARNAGEVMGVFGVVDASQEGSLTQLRSYNSSIRKGNLIEVEELVRELWSPEWPKEFGAIDPTLRAKGEILYNDHCLECHDLIKRNDKNRVVTATMGAVGTDQAMARNFATRVSKTGVLNGRRKSLAGLSRFDDSAPSREMLVHFVERVIARPSGALPLALNPSQLFADPRSEFDYRIFANVILNDKEKLSGDFRSLTMVQGKVKALVTRAPWAIQTAKNVFFQQVGQGSNDRFEAPDGATLQLAPASAIAASTQQPGVVDLNLAEPKAIEFKYKGRPLNGIWATAPYLHNGSVPNLDELLKPANARNGHFKVGSREFDPVLVGLRTDQGSFDFDATLPGNLNVGHEYPRPSNRLPLTDDERRQLIEFLKSL